MVSNLEVNFKWLNKTLSKPAIDKRFIKFCIIGGFSTLLNYIIFYCFYKLFSIHYFFSSIFGYLVGLFFGYFFNKLWTYAQKIIKGKSYLFKYIAAQLLGLVSNQIMLLVLVELLKFNPLYGNIISLTFAAITSFILIEFFVFKGPNI